MKMKLIIFLISLLSVFSISAQKAVRKNIKQGNRSYNEQKYEQAAQKYEEAVKINPNALEANYNLGNTLYRQNEWDKSIEQQNHYLMLEKENPKNIASAWHNIGNAILHKKDLEKSMEAYKMALRVNPYDDETRYNLAVVQKMISDQQQDQDKDQQQDKNKDQKDNDQQQQPPEPQDKQKKPEEQTEPEQMSRDNARQILQAIEQDEKETQKRLNEMKAEERKQQAQENRRQNKDW